MKVSLRQRGWRREWVWPAFLSTAVVFLLAFFFYRSLWAVLPLAGAGIAFFRNLLAKSERRKKQELEAQFKECIQAVATLLQAGYSAENAFSECRGDMVLLFGEDALICRELKKLRRGLHINISLEELLADMAERTECEDIRQFARIFALAKRNGGNMAEIIRSTASLIGKRIELRQETETLLAGKKLELGIMRAMPFGILCYIELGNPGYFQALYHNGKGILIMTVCLAVYLTAYLLGERIMNRLWAEMM